VPIEYSTKIEEKGVGSVFESKIRREGKISFGKYPAGPDDEPDILHITSGKGGSRARLNQKVLQSGGALDS